MPSFPFTAASATDQLTITGHGLVTGAGPGTTLVPGGSFGGLTDTADYYAIVIDANTIKLATSNANALAGTPVVDVTANVSGIFGIGLPYRRARTYSALSQVKSADLNAIQDTLRYGRHGKRTKTIAGAAFVQASGTTHDYTSGGELRGTPVNALGSLGLNVGDRILEVRVYLKDSATGPTTVRMTLASTTTAGVQTPIANVTSAGSGADQTLSLTGLSTTITAANGYALLMATISGSAQSTIRFVEIDYDHPV